MHLCTCVLVLLLLACAPIPLTQPVTKLGLVAPFEGKRRALGYEALHAARLALRERNATGGVAGWLVELVALDAGDQLEQSLRQARTLAVDPNVTYVIEVVNHSEREPVQAAYAQLNLPLTLVAAQPDAAQSFDAAFVERYRAYSGGAAPSPFAASAYFAAQAALRQIEQRIRTHGRPTR